ncbi:hypothetical protein D3C75_1169000 [compost metagenome]
MAHTGLGVVRPPGPPVAAATIELTEFGHGSIDTQSVFAPRVGLIPDADAKIQSAMIGTVECPAQAIPVSRVEADAEAGITLAIKQTVIPQQLDIQAS